MTKYDGQSLLFLSVVLRAVRNEATARKRDLSIRVEQEPSSELAALIFSTLDVDIFLSRVDRHNILVVKNWIEFAELVELVNYFLKILRFLTDPLFEILCLRILSDQ